VTESKSEGIPLNNFLLKILDPVSKNSSTLNGKFIKFLWNLKLLKFKSLYKRIYILWIFHNFQNLKFDWKFHEKIKLSSAKKIKLLQFFITKHPLDYLFFAQYLRLCHETFSWNLFSAQLLNCRKKSIVTKIIQKSIKNRFFSAFADYL